jgi:hypothetical protein
MRFAFFCLFMVYFFCSSKRNEAKKKTILMIYQPAIKKQENHGK